MKYLNGVWPILGIVIFSMALLWGSQLNHDTSWYLISTKWWLHGIPIYEEILELNPPLAFYLTMPPVFIADSFGLDPVPVMKIYVSLIALLALLWARNILLSSGEFSASEVTCLSLAAGATLMLQPIPIFAEREHIMLLFVWPYVAMSLTTAHKYSSWQAILVGLFAALGLALKPYFLAIPLFISLTNAVRTRTIHPIFSAQNLTILGFCVFYVIASWLLHPAYFDDIIPQSMLVYDAYKSELSIVVSQIYFPLFIGIFIGICAIRIRKPGSQVSAVLISAALAGLASYLIQFKGWTYHATPYLTFLTIVGSWCAYVLYVRFNQKLTAGVLAATMATLILEPALIRGPYNNGIHDKFASYFSCPKGQRSFQVFGSNVWPSFPMANYADAIPANRAPALWRFPGLVRQLDIVQDEETRSVLNIHMNAAREDVINNFLRVRPQLVFVDARKFKPYFGVIDFSYIDEFSKVPTFRTSWSKYRKVGDVYGFDIYHREGCEIPNKDTGT